MEIKPEFESELRLYNVREFVKDKRKFDECIPENLKEGREYGFLLPGQKFFGLLGKFPLIEINEDEKKPGVTRATVNLLEVTHFTGDKNVFTKGKYKIVRVMDKE
jgi:hypothetical protein